MSDLARAMWRQAVRDLAHAAADQAGGYHEWAAYSAQQAAEKGLKAALSAAGRPFPSIHGLNRLFDALVGAGLATAEDKRALQKPLSLLDQAYGMARYPHAEIGVAPADLIDADQGAAAIAAGASIIGFVRGLGIEAE
jgi:HEPN domain-containing protein